MRLKYLAMLFAVLALSVALFACSGDDDDSGGNSDQPTATTEASGGGDASNSADQPTATKGASGDGDGGSGSGTATLTIGDETWEADGIYCAFSTEESRNDNVPFTAGGFTETSTGARAQIDASVVDLSGAAEISPENLSLTIDDVDDFENPSVSWGLNKQEVFGGSLPDLQIDGKNVTIEGVFDDGLTENEFEAVPGTFVASCP
jgi:hypothetical protein